MSEAAPHRRLIQPIIDRREGTNREEPPCMPAFACDGVLTQSPVSFLTPPSFGKTSSSNVKTPVVFRRSDAEAPAWVLCQRTQHAQSIAIVPELGLNRECRNGNGLRVRTVYRSSYRQGYAKHSNPKCARKLLNSSLLGFSHASKKLNSSP